MKPALIVHGGAGAWDDSEDASKAPFLEEAVSVGWKILLAGGSALEAVEKAVNVLEDAPVFDAGIGSHLNAEGIVEMDAIICDGTSHNFGAVAGVQRVRYPISLAHRVMTHTPHNFFVGQGADALGRTLGLEIVPNVALVTPQEWQNFINRRPPSPTGTVGAVAIDEHGNIAAATSTGGTPLKMPGRVGDSPVYGAGGYADTAWGGASATGWGENILRVMLTRYAVDQIEQGMTAQQAADAAIAHINARFNPSMAGLIVVDKDGRIGYAHSTPKIAVSWLAEDGRVHTAMR
jgi:beta-aspartyl-peptidase (threonine type)